MLSFILATILFLSSSPVFFQAVFLDRAINNNSYTDMDFPYSLGPKLTAESALVVDLEVGKTVFAKNPTKVLSIASITKLMTALVFLENRVMEWDEKVFVKPEDLIINSESDSDVEPAGLGLKSNQSIKLKDVFFAGLIRSANDAMKILARLTDLPKEKIFVDLMNEKAKFLGMNNTYFTEPTGLDVQNVSTAEDLVELVLEAIKKDEIREATKIKTYDFPVFETNGQKNYQRVWNTNKLLNSFIDSIEAKTGYLEESGYCFAGLSNYQGCQLVVIVLKAATDEDRFQEAKSLVYWTTSLKHGNMRMWETRYNNQETIIKR